MVYIIIDVLYIFMILGLYKLRINSHIMKEWDNGYMFYQSLSDDKKEIYWKKDTQLVILLMLCIGVAMNFFFLEIELNVKISVAIITFLCGIIISLCLYIYLYFRLKKMMKE